MSEGHARRLPVILFASGSLWALVLGYFALHLPLDYSDGFEFLGNAALMAGHSDATGGGYNWARPPLWSLMLMPLHLGARSAPAPLWPAHLLAVLVAVAAVLAGWRLFRHSFGLQLSALGGAALALNRLVVHYAPFALADILSMLTTTAASLAWLKARQQPTVARFALAGALIGLAVTSKLPLVLLPAAIALFEVLRPLTASGTVPRQRGYSTAAIAALAAIASIWTAALALGVKPLTAENISAGLGALGRASRAGALDDPKWELLDALRRVLGTVGAACALLGLVGAARDRRDEDLFHLTWTVVYLLVLSTVVRHREARYVLPVLPSVLWLVLRGARQAGRFLPARPVVRGSAAALVLAAPALGAADEVQRFLSPPYREPVLAAVVESLADADFTVAGNGTWSVFAPQPVVFPHDEFMHFHHLSAPAFEYLAARRQTPLERLAPGRAHVVITPPSSWYDARNVHELPPFPEPLAVTLTRPGEQPVGRVFHFTLGL